MISRTTARFRAALADLPRHVRSRARQSYRLFLENPSYPGLQFKRVHPTLPIYSARIGLGYRALATLDGDEAIWFWIGTHPEYERVVMGTIPVLKLREVASAAD